MKNWYASVMLLVLLLNSCKNEEKSLYSSTSYSIYKDKVVQGDYTASVLSSSSIQSNYQSPVHLNYSSVIEFKFSINQKDNELPYGVNHQVFLSEPIALPKLSRVIFRFSNSYSKCI